MAALRKTLSIFSSENDDPVALKRAGSDLAHPSKLTKLASTKDAVRKPLALKSANVIAPADPKMAVKKAVVPAVAAPAATRVLPAIPEKPLATMDTKDDFAVVAAPVDPAIEDIDKLDDDPQLAAEYTKDIYRYMRELEVRYRINTDYMQKQDGINAAMRTILIDWLVEVHKRFKLVQESLYLTVHVLDRFLDVHTVSRSKLQLVGLGCLLVASKYEDTWPPRISDLIFIADKAYTRQEIISMECLILDKLEYNLGCPMPLNFLRRYSKVADSEAEVHTLAKYLLEISLLDFDMCAYTYSQQAAASLSLARIVFSQPSWSKTLSFHSGYEEHDIKTCVDTMSRVLVASVDSKYQAVRSKFASPKMMSISSHDAVESFIAKHKSQ